MTDVDSSMIRSVGYSAATRTLRVLFASGKTYEYREVPAEVHQGLMNSGSKGSYMCGEVIDCYPTSQVKERGRR
ncbi:KTSC domain-containing protein [Deinococcus radiomollis]|uniref:KTSC domain-containing protein n=1 Tax=Deinococcus radiomollis TaxID=468916 RepID=UPI0038915CF9